jgi:hypothetical protein
MWRKPHPNGKAGMVETFVDFGLSVGDSENDKNAARNASQLS